MVARRDLLSVQRAPRRPRKSSHPANPSATIPVMVRASARHILVPDEKTCLDLKRQIEGGADFAKLAAKHSKCPSGKQGGALGEFGKGQMVPEFDKVVFNEAVGVVHGPVKTQFGFHLVEVTKRA